MPAILLGLVLVAAGCSTSPTGRPQLRLFPQSQLDEMGNAAYRQMREAQPTLPADSPQARYVRCVTDAVTAVAPGQWEVTVFDDDSANAFALPGGNIGVHTGLLDVAENQDQLATVIGHELAHVLADHPNARMSTQFATQAGLELASAIAGGTPRGNQVMAALGVGAQVGVLLPFTRGQETEADVVGLELMAKAGFEPEESLALWRNMAASGGQRPPELLSTHPLAGTRIETLRENLPAAEALAAEARAAGRRPDCARP